GHRLRHIRARIKLELDDGGTLNRLRLHMLDASDVKEVILVVIGEVTFHLRRVHAAEWLRDVNGGNTQRGENVTWHLAQCQDRAKRHGKYRHHDSKGAAHRRLNKVHR